VSKWTRDSFGLKGNHTQTFFPLAVAEENYANFDSGRAHPVWARVLRAAYTGECPTLLDIKVPSGSLTIRANLRVVLAKKKRRPLTAADGTVIAMGPTATALRAARILNATSTSPDHCALLAMAYLAAQPEVNACSTLYLMKCHSVIALFPL